LQREIETVNVFLREYEEGSSDWLWSIYGDGIVRSASPRMLSVMRLNLEQVQNYRLQDLLTTETDTDNRPTGDLASFFLGRLSFRDHLVRYQTNDEIKWFALTGHPIADRKGTIVGFRGIGRDVTKTHTAAKEIKFLAHHDSLTGLLNRRSFIETADKLCADGHPFALALIDLDSFKTVNDSFGHHVGDSLLRSVAARIRHQIRPFDIAARLGGDEFAVIIRDADETLGHAIADRLVASLSERFETAGISLMPGASLGISASPSQGNDTVRLLMLADLALYKAKEAGKGTARVFAKWMEEEHRVQMTKEADLLNAIENGQIVVAYQPIVDIATGQVVSGEALVRWQHPTRGTIMPGEFIPIAERNDLIERLGELVLRIACRDAASWSSPIQVNVNVSPRQLKSGRFPQILTEALEESQLPPQRLGLEVTETLLLDSTGKMLQQLQSFRDLGIKLVLDDFGSGYSSLSYLHKIDVDGIKLDADFLKKLPDRKVAAIYRMVATLAADLNIYVVAEGIEDPAQLEWLKKNGIQFGQGYLLGRPELSPPTRKIEYLMR
ncbi:MAG: GGDEF and EAL domain-containing protein, partial [Pseudomonas sp.]